MTPEEKAKELCNKYFEFAYAESNKLLKEAMKECALICVDEILNIYMNSQSWNAYDERVYWKEVKEEIKKL